MAEKVKIPSVKAGDKVVLVTGWGKPVEATVEKIGKEGLIDLTAVINGAEEIRITASPYDPAGKLPDSWHTVSAN